MICDQCGFEHNSKGVCPKCGARVVYVNEDYERRRQAFLEAQKKAAAGEEARDSKGEPILRRTPEGKIIPPGVHYSTEDEHNMKKGRDRATSRYEEENKESRAGQLAVGLLQRVILAMAAGVVQLRKKLQKLKKKQQRKRGVNNPVINKLTFEEERNLKFDDGKETLDTSKLVLAHKVFADKRIPIFFGALGGLVLIIGLIVFLAIWTHMDHTRVLVYGQGTFSVTADSGNTTIEQGLVIRDFYKDTKQYFAAPLIIYPELTVYNKDASKVYYLAAEQDEQDVRLMIHLPKLQRSYSLDNTAQYSEMALSQSGNYLAITGCIAEEIDRTETDVTEGDGLADSGNMESNKAEEIYLLYLYDATTDILRLIAEDYYYRKLLAVTDAGIVYERQTTGAYGVLLEKSLEIYSFDSERFYTMATQYTDYEVDVAHGYLYFVAQEKLYATDLNSLTEIFLDDQVQAISLDGTDAYLGVLYEKKNGYYTIHPKDAGEEGELVLSTRMEGLSFYVYPKAQIMCVSSMVGSEGKLYVLENVGKTAARLTDEDLAGKGNAAVYDVTELHTLENADGLVYVTQNGINVMRVDGKKFNRLGLDSAPRNLQNAIWTRSTYALMGTDGIIYRFDSRGVAMENVSAYATWSVSK